MEITEQYIAQIKNKIVSMHPIVHCITNVVTVNDCANALLALGASPVMAHHPLEVEEVTSSTHALVCNLGAISDYEAMVKAGLAAHKLGHPIVIDPVGIAGSSYRRLACQQLVEQLHPTCIRGNYSEIRALMEDRNTAVGVDTQDHALDLQALEEYACSKGLIVVASGPKDIITDGRVTCLCTAGDSMMTRITGTGCMSSALLGAFLAAETSVDSAAACCFYVGHAGERAAQQTVACGGGTMTFHHFFIDAL